MKKRLKRITIEETRNIISDKEVLKWIEKEKEPTLKIKAIDLKEKKNDPLLDLEIALRKCKRVGVFEK